MSTPRTRSPPSATPARADAVAVDVRRCGSGDLVVVQDATVDRITNREGAVVDMTAAELVALDVLGSGEGGRRSTASSMPPRRRSTSN
jgi:glycerophosphoryl diester phosphodiesterase